MQWRTQTTATISDWWLQNGQFAWSACLGIMYFVMILMFIDAYSEKMNDMQIFKVTEL
jgi:hypothetical protein